DRACPRVRFPGGARGTAGEHDLTDRSAQLVALRQVAEPQAGRHGHPAGVGRHPAGQQPEQGGLPGAVAACYPYPVPGGHAERDAVEQRAVRVRLGRLLQADQVHRSPVTEAPETMAAPGTGPLARATDRHTPAPDSDAARSRARSALAARNTQVGPEPATSAPSAPSSSPAARVLRSAGNSDSAAGCRSLLSARPTSRASPDRSADMSAASRSGWGGSWTPWPPARVRCRSSAAYTSGVDRYPSAKASTQWYCVAGASAGVSRSPRPR